MAYRVTTHQLIPNNCPHKHSWTTLQCNVFYFQSRWRVPVIRYSSLADRLSFVKPQKLQHFISRVSQTFSFLTPTDFKDLDDLRHVANLQRTEEWSPICSTLQQNPKPRASISPCIWHKTLPKKKGASITKSLQNPPIGLWEVRSLVQPSCLQLQLEGWGMPMKSAIYYAALGSKNATMIQVDRESNIIQGTIKFRAGSCSLTFWKQNSPFLWILQEL